MLLKYCKIYYEYDMTFPCGYILYSLVVSLFKKDFRFRIPVRIISSKGQFNLLKNYKLINVEKLIQDNKKFRVLEESTFESFFLLEKTVRCPKNTLKY